MATEMATEIEMGPVNGSAAPGAAAIEPQTSSDGLRPELKERHVNMIGFSFVLGIGLFLSSGKIIAFSGPGIAFFAILLMGTYVWTNMACMGEMTALFPVKGPPFEFSRRLIDESVGFATAWMLWFGMCTVTAAEMLGIGQIFDFDVGGLPTYPAGIDYLREIGYPQETVRWWPKGKAPNRLAWVAGFMPVILVVNLLPVRQFGRIEYIIGCCKICFLIGLIMFNIINAPGFRYWNEPYGFSTSQFTPKNETSYQEPNTYYGDTAHVMSLWTAMTTSLFAMMGWNIILITAPENRHLMRAETVKLSTRKIALRVILLYGLTVFTAGLNVPYDDAILQAVRFQGVSGGDSSVFVLAVVRARVKFLPHLVNAFFIFSATSTAFNALYAASRILHAISCLEDFWPKSLLGIRARLQTTKAGVPVNAVITSWLLGLGLSFLCATPEASKELQRIMSMASSTTVIIYMVNAATFLLFLKEINSIAKGTRGDDLGMTDETKRRYNRDPDKNPLFPYRSHAQWARAAYGLGFGILIVLFHGWISFVPPFTPRDFVAAYISIAIFIVLTAAHFLCSRRLDPQGWHLKRKRLEGLEQIGPIAVDAPGGRRRGKIYWPRDQGWTGEKAMVIMRWMWEWIK